MNWACLYYSLGRLEPLYRYAAFYALNIGYFYAHAALLDRCFYRPKPAWLRGLFSWLLLLGLYLLVKSGLDLALYGWPPAGFRSLTTGYLFRAGYFTLLATAYWASGYIAYYRGKAAELRNAYLEQQISPHMLFNTLNFIYSEVRKSSPGAARSVLLLSDILRFGIEAAGPDGRTGVDEELVQVGQLAEINRYRFAAGFYFELETEGDFAGLRIIPLVLLTLSENLFKHGHLGDPGEPARIVARALPGQGLYFCTENRKKAKNASPRSRGTGLRNIRARLDHAYAGRYRLDIRETADHYTLTLTIRL